MQYYMAPMEGVTTEVFRRAYHACFSSFDKYFTPFLTPHLKKGFNAAELREIDVKAQKGMYIVPQILTNQSEDFIRTVKKLEEFGYKEVNLNLGCPAKTVVSKNRGSGFLAKPEELDRFLDEIYSGCNVKISIKTRIGKLAPEEFEGLLKIYNQYSLEELIIHPRVQQDFYNNHPNLEVFGEAVKHTKFSICYNGDVYAVQDEKRIREKFPTVEKIMLGRGIVGNPFLLEQIRECDCGTPWTEQMRGGDYEQSGNGQIDVERLRDFLNLLEEEYRKTCSGDRPVLYKMKEVWYYLGNMFPGCEKELKQIKKAEKMDRYHGAINAIFSSI